MVPEPPLIHCFSAEVRGNLSHPPRPARNYRSAGLLCKEKTKGNPPKWQGELIGIISTNRQQIYGRRFLSKKNQRLNSYFKAW
jgi:hypothetical protein